MQVESVVKRSKLEIAVLLAMFHAGERGKHAAHFDAMMRKYPSILEMLLTEEHIHNLNATSDEVVWGTYSSLLDAGLIQGKSRYATLPFPQLEYVHYMPLGGCSQQGVVGPALLVAAACCFR